MAINNIRIKEGAGGYSVPTQRWNTEAAATDIAAGEPVKAKVAGSNYAIPLADAEPLIGTTTDVIGISQSASTHTASADGFVDVYVPIPGVVYNAKAKTSTNADTEAEILALIGKRVLLDLTSGVYTVDTTTVDNAANGILIVGGNANEASIDFVVRSSGTILN